MFGFYKTNSIDWGDRMFVCVSRLSNAGACKIARRATLRCSSCSLRLGIHVSSGGLTQPSVELRQLSDDSNCRSK